MRRLALVCLVLAAAALIAAPEASAAKKKAKPAPAKQTAPYVIIPDSNLAKRLLKSGKLTPAQPVRRDSSLTTIAPYPSPLDTSRDAAQRGRILNVPKPGDYVYVTDLPEAIVRVPPNYPAEARAKGIQGTVMVKALVLKDGTVREAHASEPLQYLDRAAEACVLQWRFKPAMSGSTPVAVWVGIPVKFTLH